LWVKEKVSKAGAEVVLIDGIADVYDANESDRAKVKAFVRAMLRLIPPTGAVILIGHVNRETARNAETTEGYRGTTGWHNPVRSRMYMRAASTTPGNDQFIVELQENQFGKKEFTLQVRFDEHVRVLAADDRPLPGAAAPNDADFDALVAIIRAADQRGDPVPAASTGQRTAFNVMSVQEIFPSIFEGKKASRCFRDAIERLRSSDRIRVWSDKGPSRHWREVYCVPD
jgi:RecA-family ATPase